jgi:hypothetical protein
MSNQIQHQVARLTGRTELDAGLMRYRGLVAGQHHAVAATRNPGTPSVAPWAQSRTNRLKLAAGVVAALLLVAALCVSGAGQVVTNGVLGLTSSSSGGIAVSRGFESPAVVSADSAALTGTISGSLAISAAAEDLSTPTLPYDGGLSRGACCLTP